MMTLLPRFFIAFTIFVAVAGLAPAPASAGLEFTARPKSSRKPQVEAISEATSEATEDPAPERVQVFGTGEVRPSDAYTEMLREDEAAAPVVAPVLQPDSTETEFQALRTRIRTRQVVEAPAVVKPAVVKPTPRKPAPMETETVTPQGHTKGVGKKAAPRAVTMDAVEPDAPTPSKGSQSVNAAFPYTHLLPSPFNLPQGAWVFGSSLGYGVIDSLEISTNVMRTIQEQWNFQAKVPLIEFPTFMTTAFVDYESNNPHSVADTNPDVRLARWQPGLVTAFELADTMAFFFGGNFNFGQAAPPVTTTAGYLKGARLETDWSWLYNPQSSRLGDNALSVGATYDLTYEMFGFGLTHHWRSFTLGLHYMFSDTSRFLPIFGFQAAASF